MHLVEQQLARTLPLKAAPMGRSKGTTATRGADHTNKVSKSKEDKRDQQRQSQLEEESSQAYRPKRKATNAHIFRYLQTRNPGRLEEEDLKKALEASLEECPDFGWPAEDSASCSSSDQSNAPSASSNSSTGAGCNSVKDCASSSLMKHKHSYKSGSKNRRLSVETSSGSRPYAGPNKKGLKSSTSSMQLNHHSLCNCHINQHNNSNHHHYPYQNSHPAESTNHCLANVHSCPMFSVHNRYKPVGKKNIYNEADFFHDGIMEYIEYELLKKGLIQ